MDDDASRSQSASWGRARFVRRDRTIISGVNIEGSIVVAVRVPGAREFGASGCDGRDLKSWKRARVFASVEREERRRAGESEGTRRDVDREVRTVTSSMNQCVAVFYMRALTRSRSRCI